VGTTGLPLIGLHFHVQACTASDAMLFVSLTGMTLAPFGLAIN
jgi:hypothetical protein